jgi:hypothetical protein
MALSSSMATDTLEDFVGAVRTRDGTCPDTTRATVSLALGSH